MKTMPPTCNMFGVTLQGISNKLSLNKHEVSLDIKIKGFGESLISAERLFHSDVP